MPFIGGLAETSNGTLLFSAIAALIYLLIVKHPSSWRRTAVKTISTALLALLATIAGGPMLLVVALALGALGDAFLANDGKKAFLGGLASFLTAHLAYVWLFWMDGTGLAPFTLEFSRTVAALAVTIFAAFMLSRLLPAVESGLKGPVFVYVLAILLMGLAALTLDKPLVIAGAFMFMASDTILATEKFLLSNSSMHRRWTPYAVWALYYLGQLSIALGFLL